MENTMKAIKDMQKIPVSRFKREMTSIIRRKEIIDYFDEFFHLARGISMGERTARDDEKIRVSDNIDQQRLWERFYGKN